MDFFPTEITEHILSFCFKESHKVMLVCKRWRAIMKTSRVFLKKIMDLNISLCRAYQIAELRNDGIAWMVKENLKSTEEGSIISLSVCKVSLFLRKTVIFPNGYHVPFSSLYESYITKEKFGACELHTKSSRTKQAIMLNSMRIYH